MDVLLHFLESVVGLGHVLARGDDFSDDAAVDERDEVLGLSRGILTIIF
jgi:hypothetical protein